MKLSCIEHGYIQEATTKWVGPLKNYIGDGSDWSVNYGTSDPSRPPILYINVPMSMVNSAIRKVAKNLIIWAPNDASIGEYTKANDKKDALNIVKRVARKHNNAEIYPFPKLTHIGESHITISMMHELSSAMDNLAAKMGIGGDGIARDVEILKNIKVDGRPLFDEHGRGLRGRVEINNQEPFKVFRAGFYRDEVDETGPMLVALSAGSDLYYRVRTAMGLSPRFTLPNGVVWEQHITLGYIPKKNMIQQSYLDRFGPKRAAPA